MWNWTSKQIDKAFACFLFSDWQKTYGEVVTLHFMMGSRWIILNSPAAIREGYIKNADYMSERPKSLKGLIVDCK